MSITDPSPVVIHHAIPTRMVLGLQLTPLLFLPLQDLRPRCFLLCKAYKQRPVSENCIHKKDPY